MRRSPILPTAAALSLLALPLALASPAGAQSQPLTPLAAVSPGPQAEDPRVMFDRANALLEARKYAEALAEYKKLLELDPGRPGPLWNGGMAAFALKEYRTAADYFQRFKAADPNNGMGFAKLVQTYEALGDAAARDAERIALRALHKSGKDESSLAKRDAFCRDQYTVGGKTIFAYEKFEFRPRVEDKDVHLFAARYDFVVVEPDDTQSCRIEVGWDEPTKKRDGTFAPGGSFYFDAYYPTGEWRRRTFGLFESEMTYAECKAWVGQILAGKAPQTGGQVRSAKETPGKATKPTKPSTP